MARGVTWSMDTTEVFRLAAQLSAQVPAVINEAHKAVRYWGTLGVGMVKAGASGRPGPRVRTGDYRRSINVRFEGPFEAVIGTNAPQARRLEYGFVGKDSLGRMYNQPPLPHWRPAGAKIEAGFVKTMEEIGRKAWGLGPG